MSKTEKLLQKLENGNIKADELRTLLGKMGYELKNTEGSHEQWVHPNKSYPERCFTLATHSKDLKPYQMREAKKRLLKKE